MWTKLWTAALLCALAAAAEPERRWSPMTVEEYLAKEDSGAIKREDNRNEIYKVRRLDRGFLSRMLLVWGMHCHQTDGIPQLAAPWKYADDHVTLEQRFHIYKMAFATQEVRGDGNCLFNSLAAGFKEGGLTAERLKKFLNPESPPHLLALVRSYQPAEAYYTPVDLKRFSLAAMIGVDVDSPESVALFDPDLFRRNLQDIWELLYEHGAEWDRGESLLEVFNKVNIADAMKRFDAGEAPLRVATQVFRAVKQQHDQIFGSFLDIDRLQKLFSFKLVMLNPYMMRISTIDRLEDGPVNFILLANYMVGFVGRQFNVLQNMRHFSLAGLVDVCMPSGTANVRPKSVIMARDIPLPLAIMLADDLRMKR
ncbi:signal peptide-containing protein [Babesia caballi]|uniref:Signal peptide-containing protein n=1 Tax=Babesia caballi TaxID=5871 RepID=A0AAV4LLZ3_BABCB|nr:signal peptide-containing protein [Babesia caballi]